MRRQDFRLLAKASGVVTFLLIEIFAGAGLYVVASVRCCAAGGATGPRDASEWIGLAIALIALLMLGLVCGTAVALLVEGAHRIIDRGRRG
jgi:hypothetical protein